MSYPFNYRQYAIPDEPDVDVTPSLKPAEDQDDATFASAQFAHAVRIELRRNGPSRWYMYVSISGQRAVRRKDFASPSLDHAKRTAVAWYGPPISQWREAA